MRYYMALDPIMTGFEQPKTMTPTGQLAAYSTARIRNGGNGGYIPPGTGILAGALPGGGGVISGIPGAAPPPARYVEPQPPAEVGAAGPVDWYEVLMLALGAMGMAIPEPITTIAGAAVAGAGVYGMFQNGNGGMQPALPVPIGGPGLAEPGKPHLIKEWHVTYPKGRAQYYLVQRFSPSGHRSRYVMMYKTWDGTWDWWRWPKPSLAVIGKNMPSHKMLTRLGRNLRRHSADAKTILRVTNPSYGRPGRPFVRRHAYVRRK